jgi:uncharacterized delta-60 repeat protein
MTAAARIAPALALTVTLLVLAPAVALAAPADLDPGFGLGGRLTLDESDFVRALAVQPDGKVLVGGDLPTGGTPSYEGVVYRLSPSSSLDLGFGSAGAARLTLTGSAAAVGLQPDGKIIAAGNAAVNRLTAQGMPDRTFDEDGAVVVGSDGSTELHALALQPDGKVVVAGETYPSGNAGVDPVVFRLNADGTPDSDFGIEGRSQIEGDADERTFALALQPNGKILVAGPALVGADTDAVVHRLNADGTLDKGFGQGGTFEIDEGGGEFAYALAQQPDGRSLVVGASGRPNITADTFVYRLRADGRPDPSFGRAGRVGIDDGPVTVGMAAALQADGKLLVTGYAFDDPDYDIVVYRLNPDGSRDRGFAADGARRIRGAAAEVATAIAVQQDGKVILGGLTASGITERSLLYRLQGGDPVRSSPATPASPAAPVLGRLRITPSAFRAAGRGPAARSARRRAGATVSFTLDRAARVHFAVARCVVPTRPNRGRRRCTRYRLLRGAFTRPGVSGANRFRLTGCIKARHLRPARYRLIATPVAGGRRGDSKRTSFRIKP